MKKIIFYIAFALLYPGVALAQNTALSTYYPAPYGAYDRVRLVPRNPPPPCNAALEGLLYYDSGTQQVTICQDTSGAFNNQPIEGVWVQDDTTDPPNALVYPKELDDAAPQNVKVGIGTKNPQQDLHIAGGGEMQLESASPGVYFINTRPGSDYKLSTLAPDRLTMTADDNDDGTFDIPLMTWKSNGFVGIGNITDPQADLHIGLDTEMMIESAVSPGFQFSNTALGVPDFKLAVVDDYFEFRSDNDDDGITERVFAVMGANGNLTLGNQPGAIALPPSQEKLNVEGKIRLNTHDPGADWGNIMVEFTGGAYYLIPKP